MFALIPTTPTQLGTQATPPGQRWLYGIPSTQRRILSVWGGEDKSVQEFIDQHMWSVGYQKIGLIVVSSIKLLL
jgi:hypothetical protein